MDHTDIIEDNEQHITLNMKTHAADKGTYISAVYAKCTAKERRDLWDNIDNLNNSWDGPWCIGGAFNVIMNPKEKCGGKPYRASKSLDFISIMEACGFLDIGFSGPKLLVQQSWESRIEGNPIWHLQSKFKLLSRRLCQWSKESIGDINEERRINKGYAEYVRWLGLQDNLMRQKTQTNWFKKGDYNSRYIHSILRNRRRRIHLHRIKNHRGAWNQGEEQISKDAIKHFKGFFNLNQQTSDHRIPNCIPTMINDQDNEHLTIIPNEEEIKEAIFSMNPESSVGPDSFNGKFFQFCWNIIKKDITAFVTEFSKGKNLTKFLTHTCLALIPKVESPSTFQEFRPISLSNFTNNIISKLVAKRLSPLLSKLVSENQSGFISRRLITENVMLAQEIVHDIGKHNKGGNKVMKLDMAKAYDRLSWSFLFKVLQRFGFCDNWIDMIRRIVDNGSSAEKRKYHRSSWENLCYPKDEGRIGIRTLFDISNTLSIKKWWRLRTKQSLWADFMKKKYFSNKHIVQKKWIPGNSQGWKNLVWARNHAEKHIKWNINAGICNFWWDTWTKHDPLAMIPSVNSNGLLANLTVKEFMLNKAWYERILSCILPSNSIHDIKDIEIGLEDQDDDLVWNCTEDGIYTNKTAWHIIRKNRQKDDFLNNIWHKVIPFKVSFLVWRLYHKKLPFNEAINRLKIYSNEWCKDNGLNRVIIEMDSKIICDMINRKTTTNMNLKNLIQSTSRGNDTVDFKHCFREANKIADYLAKLASTSGNETIYTSYHQLPQEVKGINPT
ncbi:uncharacterized protein LOC132613143 [Lycium barbarum]|uniref:uncharacterized protein LOC132613143 n=1 Tax=Lycium barbarum TaxID=112863 RepID=UPI00293F3420|nr:uncharacterized protein LOC132613143 [Lycium barbarum]